MPARPRKATAAASKPDFATLLAGARLPERTVPICLRSDLVADHEEADAALKALLDGPAPKFGGDGRTELREKILNLEAEMQASSYPFRVRALPGPDFRALVRAHPPRRTEDGSVEPADGLGVNSSTMFEALVRVSLIDPELDDEQWTKLITTLTDQQFDLLATAAWNMNTRAVDVPFSRAVSRMTETSGSE